MRFSPIKPLSQSCLLIAACFWLAASVSAQQSSETPPTPAVPPSYPTAAPPMAPAPFAIQSADGKSRLKVGGLLQSDLHAFVGGGRTGNTAFTLRRARPILDGALFDFVEFRLMPEFGEGRAILQDAFLDLRLRPSLHLRSGKFKVPYSLERLQMAADVPFVERSIANNIIPIRDVGLMLMAGPGRGGLEWELGVFNGVADNGNADGNGDNALEAVGRIFYRPFLNRPQSRFQGLGFGIAGTTGSAREPLSGQVFRSAGRSAFFRYADGVTGDGDRTRLAPQFFWYTGSLGFLGEHFTTRQRIRKGTVSTTDTISGLNLQATYVLTGEKTSFRNVVPRRPFDSATGRGGAYEVALRYSQFRADRETFRLGLADAATSAQKADALTLGLNWYLNRQVKAQVNYERTDFGRPLVFTGSAGTQRVENAVLAGLQLNF